MYGRQVSVFNNNKRVTHRTITNIADVSDNSSPELKHAGEKINHFDNN